MDLASVCYRKALRRFLAFYCRADQQLNVVWSAVDRSVEVDTMEPFLLKTDTVRNLYPLTDAAMPQGLAGMRFNGAEKDSLQGDVLLDDAIATTHDVWQLLRVIGSEMGSEQRLFIVHTNFLWSPIIRLWRKLRLRKRPERSWLAPADVENLLQLNGFEVVTRDYGLLFPLNVPLLGDFINRFLTPLPVLRRLALLQLYVARRQSGFTMQKVDEVSTKVSLIIPTKDERGNIRQMFELIPKLGRQTELVFVDGNSVDGTWEEIHACAKEFAGRFEIKILRQQPPKGKGPAVWQGFAAATGDLLIIFDSDVTVRCEDLPKFVLALTEGGADFVMGSRLVYPMEGQAMRTLNNIANKFFALAFSWLLNQRIKDTLCGTKGIHRKFYEWIRDGRDFFGDFDPFGDFDLIFGAVRHNLKIVEIPIRYRDRTYGDIKISRFTHGWLLLKMVVFAARKIKFH